MAKFKLTLGSLLALSIVFVLVLAFTGSLPASLSSDASVTENALAGWVFISVFGLWIWMAGDFFVGRPMRARVVIGFAFFFFTVLTALFYFIFVYAPRIYRDI